MKKQEKQKIDGVWIENTQKVYLYDLKLNESVVHPVWGRGFVMSLKERELIVKFETCTKTFIEGAHLGGDDLIEHLYKYPIEITHQ